MKLYQMQGNPDAGLVFWYKSEHMEFLNQKAKEAGEYSFDMCFKIAVGQWVNGLELPLEFMRYLTEYPDVPNSPEFSDIISITIGYHFALSPKACEILQPYLEGNVEELFYGLPESHAHYRCFNVINFVDALDHANCKRGHLGYNKFHFYEEKVASLKMFQDITPGETRVIVPQSFVDTVAEHGLTNFWFKLLWDSEDPDYICDLRRHPRRPANLHGRRTKALRAEDDAWMEEMFRKTRINMPLDYELLKYSVAFI